MAYRGFIEITPPWRSKAFASVEELWDHFTGYVEHTDNTPMVEPKLFSTKNGIAHGNLDKMRAYTLPSFCAFLGITLATWKSTKDRVSDAVLVDAMEYIEMVISSQQIEGAITGMFHATIISRLNGLVEKQEVKTDGRASDAAPVGDEHMAILIHPDDPDPLNTPRPLFSQAQLDAGIPFPTQMGKAIEFEEPDSNVDYE